MSRPRLFVIAATLTVAAAVPSTATAYYHAQLGRFLNRDPIGYRAGDANVYRYVGNRPTGSVDPFGLRRRDDGRDVFSRIPFFHDPELNAFPFLSYASTDIGPTAGQVRVGFNPKLQSINPTDLNDLIHKVQTGLKQLDNPECGSRPKPCVGVLELVGHAHGQAGLGGTGMSIGAPHPLDLADVLPNVPGIPGIALGRFGAALSKLPFFTPFHNVESGEANYLDENNAWYVGRKLKKELPLCSRCLIMGSCNVGTYRSEESMPQTLFCFNGFGTKPWSS